MRKSVMITMLSVFMMSVTSYLCSQEAERVVKISSLTGDEFVDVMNYCNQHSDTKMISACIQAEMLVFKGSAEALESLKSYLSERFAARAEELEQLGLNDVFQACKNK